MRLLLVYLAAVNVIAFLAYGDDKRRAKRPGARRTPEKTLLLLAAGFGVDYQLNTPAELAKAFHVKRELGMRGGLLVTNPIPEEYSMDKAVIDKAIAEAVEDAKKDGIHGKATTPYLLAKIKDLTGGDSLDSNIQLVFNNARLGAAAAVELAKLEK